MVSEEIIRSASTRAIIERARNGEAPDRLSIEEVCILIAGSEEPNTELLEGLIEACLRRELRAKERRRDSAGRPLKGGKTYWVERTDMKRYLIDRGIKYESNSALGRWLKDCRSDATLRACQIDKQYVQLHCAIAWEIDPDWILTGPDGVLALLDSRLLRGDWKDATLLRWAREARRTPGKAGRPRREKIDFDD